MSNNDKASSKNIIVTVLDYKNEFKKRLLLIISIAIIFSLIGFGFSKLQEDKYKSVLSFIVDDQSEGTNLSSISGMASQFGIDLGNASSSYSQKDVIQLMKSRLIIERTLNKKDTIGGKIDLLLNHYIRINSLECNEVSDSSSKYYNDSITTVIWNSINEIDMNILLQNDEANILNLSFTSLNPEFAKLFSEIIIDEMTKNYKKNETEKSRIILNKLERRSDSIENQLELATKNWEDAVVKNRFSTNKTKEIKYRGQMDMFLEVYKELRKNIELTHWMLLDETPLIQVIDKPVLPLENINKSTVFWVVIFSFLGVFTVIFIIILRKLVRDALKEEV